MNKLTRQLLKRRDLQPISQRSEALKQYFSQALGQRVLGIEQPIIDARLEQVFGFHLLQMSPLTNTSLAGSSAARHKVAVRFSNNEASTAGLCVDVLNLPFETDSVDGVVLHHMLDYSALPHDLLKEIRRIVRPGGDIIIVGFNPYSAMGVRAFFGRFSTHPFWDNHMLSVSRLVDWLTLLDISVQRVDYACFQLPFNKPILTRFFSRLERALTARGLAFSAGIYVVAAKNEYIPVTPIKPRWPLVRAELSSAAENGYCNDSLKVECDKQNKTDTGMI